MNNNNVLHSFYYKLSIKPFVPSEIAQAILYRGIPYHKGYGSIHFSRNKLLKKHSPRTV